MFQNNIKLISSNRNIIISIKENPGLEGNLWANIVNISEVPMGQESLEMDEPNI